MKNKLISSGKRILFSFLLFTSVIILDRLSKIWVLNHLINDSFHLFPFVDFVYVQNKGVAFGLFGNTNINFTIVSVISIGLILLILFQFFRPPNTFLIALILSGAIGNIWDRILYGFVVDFIKVGSFYVFNIADSAITISAFWIVLIIFNENRKINTISKPD